MSEETIDQISKILTISLLRDGHGRAGHLLHRIYHLLGGGRARQQMGELFFEAVRGRMAHLEGGYPFDSQNAGQTIGYAMRALDLCSNQEQLAALHFWLGQLHTLRSCLRSREQKRELRLAHSHFVQAEQGGVAEARGCGEFIWQLLGQEEMCQLVEDPVGGVTEPEAPIDTPRISLATPYLEQGRLALHGGDLVQAQAAFGKAKELAPLDLRCEDRWIIATLMMAARRRVESGTRHTAHQCLRDAIHFYQPLVGTGEAKGWAKVIKAIGEQGDLLEQIADIYREIAEQQMAEWLEHFIPEEMSGAEKIPPRLLDAFEAAWLHYTYALGSPYTTIDRALDQAIDVAQKLASLHWHSGDYSATAHIAEEILTYLPQRRNKASSYFHGVLVHACVAQAEGCEDKESLLSKAQDHAARAIREDPESAERQHLSDWQRHPEPDLILVGQVRNEQKS